MAADRPSGAEPDSDLDGDVVDCGPASLWTAPPAVPLDPGPVDPGPAGAGPLRPTEGVRMAWVGGGVVALDLRRDRYLVLGPAASRAVRVVVAAAGSGLADATRAALEPVLRAGLLAPSGQPAAPFRLPEPREPGGVMTRSPMVYSGRAVTAGGPIRVMRARRLIVGCDRLARERGLAALLSRLQATLEAPVREAIRAHAERLVATHDRAWLLVGGPHRSEVAAAALALDAWRSGIAVRVRLGVQRYPFHARMWVECEGRPAGGPPDLGDRLAPLVTVGSVE